MLLFPRWEEETWVTNHLKVPTNPCSVLNSTQLVCGVKTKKAQLYLFPVPPFWLLGGEGPGDSDAAVRCRHQHLVPVILWDSSPCSDGWILHHCGTDHFHHHGWPLQQWNRPSWGSSSSAVNYLHCHSLCLSSWYSSQGVAHCRAEILTDHARNTRCSHHCIDNSDHTWF